MGTVVLAAPSAHAQPVCVRADFQGTVNYSTGLICRYEYPLATFCGGQDIDIQRPYEVITYYVCVPAPMFPDGEETP